MSSIFGSCNVIWMIHFSHSHILYGSPSIGWNRLTFSFLFHCWLFKKASWTSHGASSITHDMNIFFLFLQFFLLLCFDFFALAREAWSTHCLPSIIRHFFFFLLCVPPTISAGIATNENRLVGELFTPLLRSMLQLTHSKANQSMRLMQAQHLDIKQKSNVWQSIDMPGVQRY